MSDVRYTEARQQMVSRRRRLILFRLHAGLFTVGLILFFFWLRAQPFGNPIFLIPPTAWAFLLIGHWFLNSWANERHDAAERLWDSLYGMPMTKGAERDTAADVDDLSPNQRIRAAVEVQLAREKVKRRRLLFRINLAAYLVAMLLGWIVIPVYYGPFLTASSSLTIFLLSFGGLVQVVLHYMAYRLDTADGDRGMRERLLGRALMGQADDVDEKVKRRMRLTEDGELLDIVEDDDVPDSISDSDAPFVKRMNG